MDWLDEDIDLEKKNKPKDQMYQTSVNFSNYLMNQIKEI